MEKGLCGKSITRLQNKTILRACEVRSQSVSFALPRSVKLSLSHSIVLHMVLRISLVLPVFLLHPTAKIWRDISTSLPSLIMRKLRLLFTKLYIFYKLKNVQSIVDRRNWTRVNYFKTTWTWWRRRRHRSWALRIHNYVQPITRETFPTLMIFYMYSYTYIIWILNTPASNITCIIYSR